MFHQGLHRNGAETAAQLILDLVNNIEDKIFLRFGRHAAALAIQGAVKRFPKDFKPYLSG
ncbi:MAG: hypothetical protein LC768_02720 [Acidobacteria bacterium]|nr:hypothetical protein [Acidobacteriota bacterium]MCA1637246.1 hypothetical protein [Acidobacteriota bacterium]